LIHLLTDGVNDGGVVVLLFLSGEALAVVEDHLLLVGFSPCAFAAWEWG